MGCCTVMRSPSHSVLLLKSPFTRDPLFLECGRTEQRPQSREKPGIPFSSFPVGGLSLGTEAHRSRPIPVRDTPRPLHCPQSRPPGPVSGVGMESLWSEPPNITFLFWTPWIPVSTEVENSYVVVGTILDNPQLRFFPRFEIF